MHAYEAYSFNHSWDPDSAYQLLTFVFAPQCMLHKSFMRAGDTCVHNPATCAHGISFSLWEKSVFDSNLFDPREEQPYRYLLSTGKTRQMDSKMTAP